MNIEEIYKRQDEVAGKLEELQSKEPTQERNVETALLKGELFWFKLGSNLLGYWLLRPH